MFKYNVFNVHQVLKWQPRITTCTYFIIGMSCSTFKLCELVFDWLVHRSVHSVSLNKVVLSVCSQKILLHHINIVIVI